MKGPTGSKHSLISFFMLILGIVLSARLFMLTVAENSKWQAFSDDMSVRAVYETAPRGDILDRKGRIIATSRPVYSVSISRLGADKDDLMETAADVMGMLQEKGENMSVTMDEVKEALSDNGYDAYMPCYHYEIYSPNVKTI